MKKSHSQKLPSEKIPMDDLLEEDRYLDWFAHYGKTFLITVVALFAILLVIYQVSTGSHSQAETDYIQAESAFLAFQQGDEPLDDLERLTLKHPDLHAKYDALVAETLLIRGETAEALPLANATLKRTAGSTSPFFHNYAKTTLTISEEKYADALTEATALKGQMLSATESDQIIDVLYIYNLLRIATLQKELGDTKAELNTWKEWKQLADGEATEGKIDPNAFRIVLGFFEGNVTSLPDYIASRERELRLIYAPERELGG